jgi:hypothetical protein
MNLEEVLGKAIKKQRVIQLKKKVIQIGKPYRATRYFFANGVVIEVSEGTSFIKNRLDWEKTIRHDYNSLSVKKDGQLLAHFESLPKGEEIEKFIK